MPGLESLERRALLATYQVGPGLAYAKLSALPKLAPGDVVEIAPGTYHEAIKWTADGTAERPITIRGVGATRPVIDGTGVNVSGAGSVPRALFQVNGDHYVIENLEFRDAHNTSRNGAGIRVVYADGTTIRNVHVHDNDSGLMSSANDNLLVEYSEFHHNGVDALAHNIYIDSGHATIRFSAIYDAYTGQNVKSRGHYTELLYNYIADSNEGEVGIVSGKGTGAPDSNALLVGNVIVSKADRTGNQTKFIDFGSDSGDPRVGTMYLANNTLVAGSPRIGFLRASYPEARIEATNNIFVGGKEVDRQSVGDLVGTNNWASSATKVPSGFAGTLRGADPGFVDASVRDFHLTASSPARDAGYMALAAVDGEGAALPVHPHFENAGPGAGTPRESDGALDLGAFEFPVTPTLAVLDARAVEGKSGKSQLVFQVSLMPPPASAVTVDFATAGVTATAGADFGATSGTLVFAPGQSAATIVVPVLGDAKVEGDETLTLSLSGPDGALLARRVATGTILDDDEPFALKVDFGAADSPVEDGFAGVSMTSRYSARAGFGWLSGTIGQRDRGKGSKLTRDIALTSEGTFAVDVSGTFEVTVTLGDASYAHNAMGVWLEGIQVDAVSTAAGEFARRTYRVEVADGQLTLGLSSFGRRGETVAIAGLEITRVG